MSRGAGRASAAAAAAAGLGFMLVLSGLYARPDEGARPGGQAVAAAVAESQSGAAAGEDRSGAAAGEDRGVSAAAESRGSAAVPEERGAPASAADRGVAAGDAGRAGAPGAALAVGGGRPIAALAAARPAAVDRGGGGGPAAAFEAAAPEEIDPGPHLDASRASASARAAAPTASATAASPPRPDGARPPGALSLPAPASSPTATAPAPSPTSTARPVVRAAPGAGVPILMYHYVRANPDPDDLIGYGLSIPPPLFAAHMDFLLERGFRVIPMRGLDGLVASGRVPDEKTVVVTLDDGYRDAYTEAYPVLRQRGFGATLYVITDLIDNPRYLTVAQIKELSAAGFEIGSHSATHSDLPSLSPARLTHELVDSRAVLERILGGLVTSFCYPSGRNSPAVRAAVRAAGYRSAVTVDPGVYRGREDRYALPRVRVYGGMGVASLARAIGEAPPNPTTWRTFLNDVPPPKRR